MADADDLSSVLRLFSRVSTSDRDDLVDQFSKILSVDKPTAVFFLESSNWNVEVRSP